MLPQDIYKKEDALEAETNVYSNLAWFWHYYSRWHITQGDSNGAQHSVVTLALVDKTAFKCLTGAKASYCLIPYFKQFKIEPILILANYLFQLSIILWS